MSKNVNAALWTDTEVAALLGISRTNTILLRHVMDETGDCPQEVLADPEKVLGPRAHLVLAFWRHMDAMTTDDWRRVIPAGDAAEAAAEVVSCDSTEDFAWCATWVAAKQAAMAVTDYNPKAKGYSPEAAAWVSCRAVQEIQRHERLAAQGRRLLFLELFGLTIDDLR